jgi:hypothetical protein
VVQIKRDFLVRLDSPNGKKITLTTTNFQTAIVWDCRPKVLYFTLLVPREPKKQIIRELFNALDQIHTPCWFSAPDTLVKEIATEHGYEYGSEPCGTDYVTNLNTKNLFKQQTTQN